MTHAVWGYAERRVTSDVYIQLRSSPLILSKSSRMMTSGARVSAMVPIMESWNVDETMTEKPPSNSDRALTKVVFPVPPGPSRMYAGDRPSRRFALMSEATSNTDTGTPS